VTSQANDPRQLQFGLKLLFWCHARRPCDVGWPPPLPQLRRLAGWKQPSEPARSLCKSNTRSVICRTKKALP